MTRTITRSVAALLLTVPVGVVSSVGPVHASALRCHGKVATIVGTTGNDVLTGTSGPDVILARSGRDTIDGRGGDDTICGKSGVDVIDGGAGDDWLSGGSFKDVLDAGDGDDHLVGGRGGGNQFLPGSGDDVVDGRGAFTTVDYTAAPGPVVVDLTAGTATGWGTDIIRIAPGAGGDVVGSRFDDTIRGTDHLDFLIGNGGTDHIEGLGDTDVIVASDGDLVGGEGGDLITLKHTGTIDGGPGDERIDATADATSIDSGTGDDAIRVQPGPEVVTRLPEIVVGDGHDSLSLNLGPATGSAPFTFDMTTGSLTFGTVATLFSGFEDVGLSAYLSSVDITGTDDPNWIAWGQDGEQGGTVRGLGGDDRINGSDGDDVLSGGPGNDRITGWTGADTIDGGDGDDSIDGGPGPGDVADAGDGTDSCANVEVPTSCEVITP